MPQFTVKVSADSVMICLVIDAESKSVLWWDHSEWKEDPSIVLAIVNAVRQAYEEPQALYDWLESKTMLPGQEFVSVWDEDSRDHFRNL